MKHPFLKSAVIVSAVAALVSCSGDGATDANNNDINLSSASQSAVDVTAEACWVLNAGQTYVITTNFVVADANGNVIGSYDDATQTIKDLNGNAVLTNIDYTALPVKKAGETLVAISSSSAAVLLSSSAIVPVSSSSAVGPAVSSAADPLATSSSATTPAVSSSSNNTQASSSSAQQVVNGNITVTGNLTQTVAQGAQTSAITFSGVSSSENATRTSWNAYFLGTNFNNGVFTIQATTVPDYFGTGTVKETFKIDGTEYTFTLTVTAGSAVQESSSSVQQQQQSSSSSAKSSSSSAKSSSSSAKSSSSSAKSSSSTAVSGSTDLVYVSGGASGSGFASRYWDCCKPSCSWTSNAGSGNEAKQCTTSGSSITDWNASSVCSGGTAATCTSQIPIIVNDNLAYAFAAVPASNGGQCGHCYALTFDGKGKYENKYPQQQLAGKVLVVMASNIGSDVEQGQFDIMIPGGGVGIYNGCANMPGWQSSSMGAQYGGLLSDCETSVGYSKTGAALMNARVSCLTEKCNSVFSGDAVAKEGCLFLATWMHAAGNPTHTYKEVECPAALKAQY